MGKFSVFGYLYRDASNYKAYGRLLLKGTAIEADVELLRQHFESGEFFIAEQLGIPAIYEELWAFSGGLISDDHVWHTFEELQPATADDLTLPIFDTVKSLTKRSNALWLGTRSCRHIGISKCYLQQLFMRTFFTRTFALFGMTSRDSTFGAASA